jgi:O-antigen/teichoic acid export membrane protein
MFMNVANLCFLIVQPYWPAIKEATVRGDWPFIRSTMRRTLRVRMTLMLAAAVVVVAFGPPLIAAWAGEATAPGRLLLVAMSVYYLLVALSGHFVILLLSFELVRMKAMLTIMVGLAHVGGFLLLWSVLGLAAMPIAGAVGVTADCLLASRAARQYVRTHDRG